MPEEKTFAQWLEEEYAAGRMIRPAAAVQRLEADPADFLRRYPLQNNCDSPTSQVLGVYLLNALDKAKRPGSVLGTLSLHKTQAFVLANRPGMNGDGYAFMAHVVAMTPSSRGPQWYALTGGPDFMVTAKLTGCSFVVRERKGVVEVAHLQPTDETGVDLHKRMRDAGYTTYGRLNYDLDKRSINILGVRSGNTWNIYSQKLEKHHLTIRSVHRVFPPE